MAADKSSDLRQLAGASFNPATQSFAVELAASTQIAISATDGDSVLAVRSNLAASASLSNAATSGSILISPQASGQFERLTVISKTETTITATNLLLTLQLSPEASGNNWFTTATTATPSGTAGTYVVATLSSTDVWLRARVLVTYDAFTSGTATVWLNGR